MQSTGLKSDDVSLGIPPAWLGRDMAPLLIFRTLSPICILSVVGYYFLLPLSFESLYCIICILTRSSRCCIFIFCCICGCIGTVVMLSQFHPHNAHVSACTLCLVGDLKSLLCGFRRERLNLHSTDFRASQSGIRALVSISLLFRYEWLSKQRVRKSL